MVIDADEGIKPDDREIISSIQNKKAIIIINKVDLAGEERLSMLEGELSGLTVLRVSAREGTGLDSLEKEIGLMFAAGEISMDENVLVTNIRHKELIDRAIESIDEARSAYECSLPLDCITIDIKNTAEHLGRITGESVGEDVLYCIFSRFCVGK